MTQELKPCPMCSGEAYLTTGYCHGEQWPGEFHRVYCGSCQLRQLFHKTPSEAVTAWNRRALAASTASDKQEALRGPLTEHQRQNAVALYMSLPHSWESANDVINSAATSGYTNGVLDAAPNPSDKQEAVYQVRRKAYGSLWMDIPSDAPTAIEAYESDDAYEIRKLYAAPPAQSAEQDRIDAERSSQIAKELRKLERYPTSFNYTERSVVLKLAADQLDKRASK
jgi:hypothetical protein